MHGGSGEKGTVEDIETSKCIDFYNLYSSRNVMCEDEIRFFVEACNIPENIMWPDNIFTIARKLKVKKLLKWTNEEFVTGMKKLKCSSVEDIQNNIAKWRFDVLCEIGEMKSDCLAIFQQLPRPMLARMVKVMKTAPKYAY